MLIVALTLSATNPGAASLLFVLQRGDYLNANIYREHRVGIASRKSQSSIQDFLRFYPLNYEIAEYFAGFPELNPIHAKAHPLPLVFRDKVG